MIITYKTNVVKNRRIPSDLPFTLKSVEDQQIISNNFKKRKNHEKNILSLDLSKSKQDKSDFQLSSNHFYSILEFKKFKRPISYSNYIQNLDSFKKNINFSNFYQKNSKIPKTNNYINKKTNTENKTSIKELFDNTFESFLPSIDNKYSKNTEEKTNNLWFNCEPNFYKNPHLFEQYNSTKLKNNNSKVNSVYENDKQKRKLLYLKNPNADLKQYYIESPEQNNLENVSSTGYKPIKISAQFKKRLQKNIFA